MVIEMIDVVHDSGSSKINQSELVMNSTSDGCVGQNRKYTTRSSRIQATNRRLNKRS